MPCVSQQGINTVVTITMAKIDVPVHLTDVKTNNKLYNHSLKNLTIKKFNNKNL